MGRNVRFKKKAKVIDILITAVSAMVSVGVMFYAVVHFGLKDTWVELILDMFYLACLVMMWMFFFNRLKPDNFNYWCTLCVGMTILIRDILVPADFNSEGLRISSLLLYSRSCCFLHSRTSIPEGNGRVTPSVIYGQSL